MPLRIKQTDSAVILNTDLTLNGQNTEKPRQSSRQLLNTQEKRTRTEMTERALVLVIEVNH